MGVLSQSGDGEGFRAGGVFREPVVDVVDVGDQFRRLAGKGDEDPNNQVEERCNAPLFLVQQRHGDLVARLGRVDPIHQQVVRQREQVGLPRTPRPNQQDVVLVSAAYRLHDARQHGLHHVVASHEQGLQGLSIHVARAVARAAQKALSHERFSFHHLLTSRQRKS